jgi:glycosyltransferase involved in cell wall biosynthesis
MRGKVLAPATGERHTAAGQPETAGRSTSVYIPLTAGPDLLHRCLRAVVEHTARAVDVTLVGEGPTDLGIERFLDELDREVGYMTTTGAEGVVAQLNKALQEGDDDVVLLAGHTVVFEGWLERMAAAGRSDTTVATAGALGNNAGILSVGAPGDPLPPDANPQQLAAQLSAQSHAAYPRIPMADGHCVWISRSALELVGPLDPDLRSVRAAVIDFSQRCLLRGLVNVAAEVFVASVHPDAAATGGALDVGEDRQALLRRYPYLRHAVHVDVAPRLSEMLSLARRALHGMSVTIDARILRGTSSGAHAQTLELIETLARTGGPRVRVLLDPAIGPDALAVLDRLPEVERLFAPDLPEDLARGDIVHRPYQVTSAEDLELLPRLGDRIVITHLDLIAFHNPGYFASFGEWQQYRRVTRQALAMADQAIFLSDHARVDALREGLVEADLSRVIPMAVRRDKAPAAARRPADAPTEPFLLAIGNDFRHKNRLFAIRLLEELRARGWNGHLALAGANVGYGSSRGDEAAYLAPRPELARAVHDLPAVGEAEKEWLYTNAAAVVYPTVYEGFGLIPFEAARAGTPCLFAPQASLADLLPAEAAVLVPWNPAESAERALPLLAEEGDERRRHIELISAAAERTSDWDTIGREVLDVYETAVGLPHREAAVLAAEGGAREAELSAWLGLGIDRGDLIGEDAHVPRDVQRALLAAVTRRRLRRPLFAVLRALYAIGRRTGRRP